MTSALLCLLFQSSRLLFYCLASFRKAMFFFSKLQSSYELIRWCWLCVPLNAMTKDAFVPSYLRNRNFLLYFVMWKWTLIWFTYMYTVYTKKLHTLLSNWGRFKHFRCSYTWTNFLSNAYFIYFVTYESTYVLKSCFNYIFAVEHVWQTMIRPSFQWRR